MKKIIYFFGVIFLSIIILLNIIYTATLDSSEHITITFNSLIYIAGLVIVGVLLYFGSKLLDKYLYNNEARTKIRKWTFGIVLIIYIIFNVIWLIKVNPPVVGDQVHAVNLAQTFYRDNPEEFLPNLTYAGIPLSQYMQTYHQQITLAFVFNVFFRIVHFDAMEILRVVNLISNVLIIIALYKICNQLSKEYKTNKVLLMLLILTFFTLPIISNFIYGDIPSLALCLFAVYFTMKYTKTEKIRYIVFTTILTMIAYMMRMNSLIFIIATVIYLILNIFKNIKNYFKDNKTKSITILIILILTIVSSITLIAYSFYQNKSRKLIISGIASLDSADVSIKVYRENKNENGVGINTYSLSYYVPSSASYNYVSSKTVCGTGITITKYENQKFYVDATKKGKCKVYFDAIDGY